MQGIEPSSILEDFEAGRINPKEFPHRSHVEVAFELLERYKFPEALLHLARGLRFLAAKAGRAKAYHETITVAFLALIAERRLGGNYLDFDDFAARNSDLFEKELLKRFYPSEVLRSSIARETFVLPK